jgi:hypothetical protein
LLLDPRGAPRGRLDISNIVRLAWTSGDTVWAIRPDELGVQWLVKYRIR